MIDMKNLTDAEKKSIAEAMIEPLRCGGMEWRDGNAWIWFGGTAYPYEGFKTAYEANHKHFPEEWCRKWREAIGK